ncbi:hypothetical protein [Streptomyces nitrosporeus]|uniref:hypothetical protein n=1 Tax=Streptomyces nitrosporeus TaxID=28894 RepID=UPI00167EA293|nr:hypothetical protein [Streptomyces nitrosporeus]GGZ27807.1 hypothetical protein GCM10010327_67770 [Streptomyces nitrosporeus]
MSAPKRRTVLEQVLKTHGLLCMCAGDCGREHAGTKCQAHGTEKSPMLAAPYPLPLTEREAALAPVSELRPWCPGCWRRARKRTAEIRAELRRQELDEAQLDLFGLEAAGGGR